MPRKMMKLEVKGKEYLIGFSNRTAVVEARRKGMEKELRAFEKSEDVDSSFAKILRFGLMEKQPEITEKEARQIIDDYIDENTTEEECVDVSKIIEFINNCYLNFSGIPTGNKKVKTIEIVEV